jgi:hypothetical protein
MKTLLKNFIAENNLNAQALINTLTVKTGRKNLGRFTADFSRWLSGYKDEAKTKKRFQSNYHVNTFMVRKALLKLSA